METVNYTVRKGDTLYSLAKQYGTTVNMLARYNGIADPDLIYEGQQLRIPVSEIPRLQKRERTRATVDHIVRQAETLLSIASAYGITPLKLAEYNNMEPSSTVVSGQVLSIPVNCMSVPDTMEYTVRKGDTLAKLAAANNTSVDELKRINRIPDPDIISEGQVIRIPVSADKPAQQENPHEGRLEYTVKSGDTLYKIASMYGVSVSYLINLNRLTDPDRLYPDQVIVIRK